MKEKKSTQKKSSESTKPKTVKLNLTSRRKKITKQGRSEVEVAYREADTYDVNNNNRSEDESSGDYGYAAQQEENIRLQEEGEREDELNAD